MNAVATWKQAGRIALWRYTENVGNYPGWHLSADLSGVSSLAGLLEALRGSGEESHRTLVLTPPTAAILSIPNNRSGLAAWQAPRQLRITYLPEQAQAEGWSLGGTLERTELRVGVTMLEHLLEGVRGISEGRGDYAIGGPTPEAWLWFWWQPGHIA